MFQRLAEPCFQRQSPRGSHHCVASLPPGEEASATTCLDAILRGIEDWGRRWQVGFAHHKTQLLVVSRARHNILPKFNGTALTPRQEIKSPEGNVYDSKLTLTGLL